jgi:hypothetical protein
MGNTKRIGGFLIGCGALVAAAIVMLGSTSAKAASSPFTFAQFIQATQSSNSNQFEYVDNGPAIEEDPATDAELTTAVNGQTGVSIPVVFTYQAVNGTLPLDLQGPQSAILTLTSSTLAGVQTASAFGETLSQQQFFGNGLETDTLTITRDTPAAEGNNSMTNLLTMTFTGTLAGQLGTPTPSLSGDTNNGNTVTYTSDFLTFSGAADDDFNMAFSSWTTLIGGLGLSESTNIDDDYYASATAAGAATFDTTITPVITTNSPEPASCTIILGLGFLTLMRRRSAVHA